MQNNLLSLITIVRNDIKGIKHTIESVFNQTNLNFEYLIIDGLSNDGTSELIQELLNSVSTADEESDSYEVVNHFKYFKGLKVSYIRESDLGIYDAMNKGIFSSNGYYVGFINSGDTLEPSAIENITLALSNASNRIDIIYGMMRLFSTSGEHLKTTGTTMKMISTEMISHPGCFISRDAYTALNGYNTSLKSASDYDFMFRFLERNYKSLFLEQVLVNFYLGGISNSRIGAKETIKIRYKYGCVSWKKYYALSCYYKLLDLIFALNKN